MKLIPLTQGKSAMVDDKDYEYLLGFTWCAQKVGSYFTAHTNLRRASDGKMSSFDMTTLIMHTPLTMAVIHLDRDHLNNQRANLRVCDRKTVNHYTLRKRITPSGYRGVHRLRDRWSVNIGVDGRNLSLGVFTDVVEAAYVYDAAAAKLHGEFAILNFPVPAIPALPSPK